MSNSSVQITTGVDFAKASAKLPKEIRAKLSKATSSLFTDPSSLGAHLEKIQAADDDVYSLRVDDCYRIIMKYPGKGNVAFLLYVDKHDEAYDWAKRHSTQINEATGGIQTSVALEPNFIRDNGKTKPNPKLASLTDANMATLGIPQGYWEQLRTKVFTPTHLLGYKKILSYEAYSTLEEMMNKRLFGGASLLSKLNEGGRECPANYRPQTAELASKQITGGYQRWTGFIETSTNFWLTDFKQWKGKMHI